VVFSKQAFREFVREKPVQKAFQDLSYKIGASSMVFGHGLVENARLLAKIVNHVEIILFHTSNLNNIPGRGEIRRLNEIRQQNAITFSVHLPASLEIGAPCAHKRKEAVLLTLDICTRMTNLDPVHYILHIPFTPPTLVPVPGLYFRSNDSKKWEHWTKRSLESLAFLHEQLPNPTKFLVENINYSPSFLKPFYKKDFCNLCLDIGHLILGGESVKDNLTDNHSVIREIHIHGVKGYEDHLCVSHLPEPILRQCFEYLKSIEFSGIVNLEVFTPDHLNGSIAVLLETIEAINGREY
jgi:sugar phosphate isomerase/epimerase